MHTNTTGSDTDRNPPMYVDIRVSFDEVTHTSTWGSERWATVEPRSISRINAVNVNGTDMHDVVETIWESNDGTKFINGLTAAIHGEETTF